MSAAQVACHAQERPPRSVETRWDRRGGYAGLLRVYFPAKGRMRPAGVVTRLTRHEAEQLYRGLGRRLAEPEPDGGQP